MTKLRDKDLCNCDQALTYKKQRDVLLAACHDLIDHHTSELWEYPAFVRLCEAVEKARGGK